MTMTMQNGKAVDFGVKSQLAKLLATEDILIQHNPSHRTASFDVKNRVLTLPVWQNISNDLYDMLVVHEVGHALDTPFDAWVKAIDTLSDKHNPGSDKAKRAIKNFLNVIEDARIDKRQKRRYPGSRRNYIVGYRELFDRNFFGIVGKDINTLPFIDRLNIYFKGGVTLNIKFSDEEKAIVDKVANAETFDDVIALTDEVYAFSKQKKQAQSEIENDDIEDNIDIEASDEMSDADGDDMISDLESEDKSGDSSDDESDDESDEESDNQSESGSEYTDSDEDDSEADTDTISGGSYDEDEIPDSITENAAQDASSSIVADDDTNYIYVTLPQPNYNKIVDDFKVVIPEMDSALTNALTFYASSYGPIRSRSDLTKAVAEFRKSENEAISFMVKEFEMRKSADTYSRISISKTGVIDTNKLHSYKYNDDIFRKLAVVPNGKNHGFFMILDWSGSMASNFKYTVKQLITLTMFCKRVQIPFEVYFFKSGISDPGQFNFKDNDMQFESFKMRNILSSRMNAATLTKAFEILWAVGERISISTDYMDSTPLNQAIAVSDKLINDFRKKHGLQIVNTIILTDGASDPCHNVYGMNPYSMPSKKNGNRYFIKDEVTKKTYNVGRSLYDSTGILMNILRDRTQANMIGFYLSSSNFKGLSGYGIDTLDNKVKKEWTENGFLSTKHHGFDEYYIIKCDPNKSESADNLQVNSKMTKAKIAKEFIRYSERKTVSRVLLSKFINRVSSEMKRA